jgi:hypothetical protein
MVQSRRSVDRTGASGTAEPSVGYTSAHGIRPRRVCLLAGDDDPVRCIRASARPLASGISRYRTLSEEGDVFRWRCRYFHEGRKGIRVLWHGNRSLREQCRAGECRQYPRHGRAETTGTAGHAHAETLTAAHRGNGTCQHPQAEDQYDKKAALTHAYSPASCPRADKRIVKKQLYCTNAESYSPYSHIVPCRSRYKPSV